MSQIRSRNTAPERSVRRALHALRYRFRLQSIRLPGTPDIVLTRHRVVVFVHGCYWHRHFRCRKTTTPKSNVAFWMKKFKANKARDRRVHRQLVELGWKVVTIWECQTEKRIALTAALRKSGLRRNSPRRRTTRLKRHA